MRYSRYSTIAPFLLCSCPCPCCRTSVVCVDAFAFVHALIGSHACCWKCIFCSGPNWCWHPGIIVLQHDVLPFAFSSLVHDRKVFWLLKVDLLHFPSPKKSSGPRSETFSGMWGCKRFRTSDQNTFPTWVMKKNLCGWFFHPWWCNFLTRN